MIAAFVNDTFQIEDINISRHIINSLFGWLAILMVGLIAYSLAGWRAAVFSMLFLLLSPRFLGHAFNNTKDAPFAAAVIAAIYFMILFFKQFPKVKWYVVLLFILSIALAISIRVGGLILFGYFGLFGFCYLIKTYIENSRRLKLEKRKNIGFTDKLPMNYIWRMLIFGIGICVVGFFAGLLIWPYAMEAPFAHTMESFKEMSAFATAIRQVFEGTMQWSDFLPWYYTPKYILITIPVAVILGFLLYPFFGGCKKQNLFFTCLIYFTCIFPVFWIVYTNANVYGGWRHAMFAYPPMVVAAGLGFDAVIRRVEIKWGGQEEIGTKRNILINAISIVVILLLLWNPIRHIIKNHPYEYVYFNELVGGTKKQLGQYELDYYYHSTREASEWIIANAEKKPDGSKVRVGTWHTASVNYFFRNDTADFRPIFIRWYEKENTDWDYAIFTVTGMSPEYLRSSYFPPKNTVKTIEVDGVPIAIILKRQDKSDCQAFALKKDNAKLDSVKLLYHKALQADPDNLGALLGIGETYVRTGQPDSALIYLNHYHEIDPASEMANYMTAYAYVYKNDAKTALNILSKIKKHNPKYAAAYILSIQIYMQQRDYVAVKKEFDKVIDLDQVNDQFVNLWLQYCAANNIDQNSAYIQLYKNMANSCERRGKKEDAQRYREAIGLK